MSTKHPAIPYVLPFATFMALLAMRPYLPISDFADLLVRTLILAAVLVIFSRKQISLRPSFPLATVLVGVGVLVVWIAPDILFPGYRQHWLFQNALTGQLKSSLDPNTRTDAIALGLRVLRAVALVPILEELFWRGWLMRWLINPSFQQVPLGQYQKSAFWLTAVLFAAEHGPYWDVGLLAGIIFNVWMVKTRSLADLIWAHAIANACLSAYVLLTGRWEYWM
jgi:uncharacterized protein